MFWLHAHTGCDREYTIEKEPAIRIHFMSFVSFCYCQSIRFHLTHLLSGILSFWAPNTLHGHVNASTATVTMYICLHLDAIVIRFSAAGSVHCSEMLATHITRSRLLFLLRDSHASCVIHSNVASFFFLIFSCVRPFSSPFERMDSHHGLVMCVSIKPSSK